MQIFMSFYEGQLKQLISYINMLIYPFKMAVQFFKTASKFPNFDDSNAYSPIQQAPGPDFRKVGKSLTALVPNMDN